MILVHRDVVSHIGTLGRLSHIFLTVYTKHSIQCPGEKLLSKTQLLATTDDEGSSEVAVNSRKCFSILMCIQITWLLLKCRF